MAYVIDVVDDLSRLQGRFERHTLERYGNPETGAENELMTAVLVTTTKR